MDFTKFLSRTRFRETVTLILDCIEGTCAFGRVERIYDREGGLTTDLEIRIGFIGKTTYVRLASIIIYYYGFYPELRSRLVIGQSHEEHGFFWNKKFSMSRDINRLYLLIFDISTKLVPYFRRDPQNTPTHISLYNNNLLCVRELYNN